MHFSLAMAFCPATKCNRICNKKYISFRPSNTRTSLKVSVEREFHVFWVRHDSGLLVFPDSLLEEVCLPLEADVVHEVEGVFHEPPLLAAELFQQPGIK
jgi:hypothetical protein